MDLAALRGHWAEQEPLAPHTTWRLGGRAACWFQPSDQADLQEGLRQWSAAGRGPVRFLGLGSNVLVADTGVPGLVVCTHRALQTVSWLSPDRLHTGAGVPGAKLARCMASKGDAGGVFWAGIPGTVGGALAMNAGAWDGTTWEHVVSVDTVDVHGVVRTRDPSAFRVGYRQVDGPEGEWFVGATWRVVPGDPEAAWRALRQSVQLRNRTQPIGQRSCGSVFRNPPGDHAGRLIQTADLKGYAIGDACVSTRHANFIINQGQATASDVQALMTHVQRTVHAVHGVWLTPEVCVWSESGPML